MTINGIELSDFLTAVIAAGMMRATPLALASLGDAFAQRAGLLNLGIEGMMLSGSFFGFYAAYHTENSALGMVAGIAAGAVLALLFGWLTIRLCVDQVLVGLAITIFSVGLTGYLFRDLFGGTNVAAEVDPIEFSIPLLHRLPIVGEALFEQQLIFYVAWLCVPLFAFLMWQTRFGLNVRAVGDEPIAADAAGISVARVRFEAIMLAGAMAGFAGAFLSVADLRIFTIGMTQGQGFIALAITMLGRWNPWRIAVGAILFGMLAAFGDGLQILAIDVDSEFVAMLPYVGIMIAMTVLAGRVSLPAALGVPFIRGQRG